MSGAIKIGVIASLGGRRDAGSVPTLAALLNDSDAAVALGRPALGDIRGDEAAKALAIATPANGDVKLAAEPSQGLAARLIEIAEAGKPDERALAVGALIRVAPLPDKRSAGERLELLQKAVSLCMRDEERNLAIKRARAIRTIETLRFLTPYLAQPAFAQQASESIVELAHHRDLREPHKAEFDAALDEVIETSQDATVVERAHRYQRGQTWSRQAGAAP